MQRRAFLKWAVNGLGAVFGAVLGIPAAAYLVDALNRPNRPSKYRTVATYNDLLVEVPTQVVIKETRTDAWTLHPDDVIGRVWLIRRPTSPGQNLAPDQMVDCYNTTCPHLGCSVNWNDNDREFLCPCHGGNFDKDGHCVTASGRRNPAPRDMDRLFCKVVDDPQTPGVKLVQVKFARFKTQQSAKETEDGSPYDASE
jgi:Rieske Fe-S protein